MRKIISLCIFFAISSNVFADTYVRGHTNKNGTYVEPHYRSDPNNTSRDNWSTQGNSNPYTGQEGTKPYQYNPPTYKVPEPYKYKNPYDLNGD